jgi:ribosome-associated translation inhibitor RaiA
MNAVVQTKNVFFPAILQEKLEKQVQKLSERNAKFQALTTTIEKDERNWVTVLMHARIPKKTLVVKVSQPRLTSALTQALRLLARAVRKTKEYRLERRFRLANDRAQRER